MVRVVFVDAGLFALFKANLSMAVRSETVPIHVVRAFIISGPSSAVFVRELGFLHLVKESQVLEDASRRRYERLADMWPGKQLALEHDAANAGLREIAGHG